MLKRGFGIHGEYSLAIQDNILRITATGPGNLELIKQYCHDVEQMVGDLSQKGKWLCIDILSGTPLLPPDGSRLVEQTIKHEKDMGLVASAIILNRVEYTQSVSRYWLEIYKKAGVNAAIFENEEQAIQWLSRQI